LIAKKDFAGAAKQLKRAEDLQPSDPGVHDLLGQVLTALGNNDGAIAEFREAIAVDPKLVPIMLELAAALEKKGDWVGSLDEYRRAALADPRPEIQERYKTAGEHFQQHLAALKASGNSAEAAKLESSRLASKVEPKVSEKLDALMQDGLKAMEARRFDEAEKHYKEAAALAEKLQPIDDRLTNSLVAVGSIYAMKNDFVHADTFYQRAYKVTVDLHGPESPELTPMLQALGSYSIHRNDYDSALDFFSRLEAINEKAYGEASDKVAFALINLATVYIVQKDYAKAEPILLRATRIDEALFGPESPGMNPVLSSLCDLYARWDKPEKAEPRYRQLLAALEKQFGADSPILLSTLSSEAKTLRELGRADEATKIEKRLQSIRTATGQTGGASTAQFPSPN
jgi:tetratricopeptide (TPR) repeat protein